MIDLIANKPGHEDCASADTISITAAASLTIGSSMFLLDDESKEISQEFGVNLEEQRRLYEQFQSSRSNSNETEESTSLRTSTSTMDPVVEEQQRMMQQFRNSKQTEELTPAFADTDDAAIHAAAAAFGVPPTENSSSAAGLVQESSAPPCDNQYSPQMIDVAPGFQLPLRSSEETWKAIMDGRVIVSQCYCCSQDLTCIEDAELLACADCWAFSPVKHHTSYHKRNSGVCIGVKAQDIVEWLSESQQEQEQHR
jgi:hypothetical protein